MEPALQRLRLAHGDLAWREAGHGRPMVLLHGIGSGSPSWAGQFGGLADSYRVIAWDAPGYGGSTALAEAQPLARHYVHVLDQWLDRLEVRDPVVVGHSLGAIVASAWAAQRAASALVLASPARGYGAAAADVRASKYRERADAVERLGIEGLAAERAPRLCAPGAAAEAIERVRAVMALATPGGYTQAAHLLANDDLTAHLRRVAAPIAVLCGEHDTITPPLGCEQIARDAGAPFTLLRGVAHACYVEDAAQFNAALRSSLDRITRARHA
jgi:pimeloyl-ACP methyl ester carboxylesterase